MGMYTKLHCNIPIKKEAKDCIEIINQMLEAYPIVESKYKMEHDFFKTLRWDFMLNSSSYYFTGTSNSKLKENSNNYVLHCDCDLKNYDGEIELFLDWISQYCCSYEGDFLGYKIYEEDDTPTLIYFRKGKLVEINIKGID